MAIKMINLKNIYGALYNRLTLKSDRGSIPIGLIGVGGWGAANAVNIMRSQRFNICGVYDKNRDIAQLFANRFRVKCYDQIDALLHDHDIHAVVISVPNQFHAGIVKMAADAGKDVFIEKPLASGFETCLELGRYCEEKQVILQVGHQMHQEPLFCRIKEIVENKSLGHSRYVQIVYTLDRRSRNDWRQNAEFCPGGSMEQLGVHFIDVLLNIFGVPKKVQGWAENIPPISKKPDWGGVSLSFAENVHAAISTSFSVPGYLRFEIFFSDGYLITDGKNLWFGESVRKLKKEKPKGFAGGVVQFVEFADCIEQSKAPQVGAAQAASIMKIVQSVYVEKGIR